MTELTTEITIKTVPIGDASYEDQHRRVLKVEGVTKGRKRASLCFTGLYEDYHIPLGYVHTIAKGMEKSEWDTVLIPIVPYRYTTPYDSKITEPERRKKALGLREGWLYIYKDGHIWRELQVGLKNDFVSDVNLTVDQNKDVRTAGVVRDNRILLPYKIDNKIPVMQVCFSEVQWSWDRINQMGGMAPDDPRLDSQTRMPNATQKQNASKLRQQRMGDAVDLTSYPQNFKVDTGNIGHIDDAHPFSSRLHHGTNIPVLYLEDPLGIARRLHSEYYDAVCAQAKLMEENKRPYTIGKINEAILKQYPKYSKNLHEDERQEFIKDYEEKNKELAEKVQDKVVADKSYRRSGIGA